MGKKPGHKRNVSGPSPKTFRAFKKAKRRVSETAEPVGRLQAALEEIVKKKGVNSLGAERAHLKLIDAIIEHLTAQTFFTFELEKALGKSHKKERDAMSKAIKMQTAMKKKVEQRISTLQARMN